MELYFQHYEAKEQTDARPLVILHGLLGASGNWHTLSRNVFSRQRDVYAVDQRNHGRSPHSPAFGYEEMAADLEEFIRDHQLAPACVLGHSMGGKTAMHTALATPDLVDRLIVVDIAPKAYPPHHEAIFRALDGLDLSAYESRRQIDQALANDIPTRPVRQFLMKNLARGGDGEYRWKMNLEGIRAAYDEISGGLSGELRARTFEGPTLFVRGETSDYVADDDLSKIRGLFPHAQLKTVEGTGHWIHADRPDDFAKVVMNFLA